MNSFKKLILCRLFGHVVSDEFWYEFDEGFQPRFVLCARCGVVSSANSFPAFKELLKEIDV